MYTYLPVILFAKKAVVLAPDTFSLCAGVLAIDDGVVASAPPTTRTDDGLPPFNQTIRKLMAQANQDEGRYSFFTEIF